MEVVIAATHLLAAPAGAVGAAGPPLAVGLLGSASMIETVLVAVVAILLAVLVGLVAMVVALRRREPTARTEPAPAPPPQRVVRPVARPGVRASAAAGAGVALAGAAEAAGAGAASRSGRVARPHSGMVCPTCSSEFHGLTYCIHDARRLVPAEEMLSVPRSAGVFCLVCRRAFEPGLRRCPHDGGPVVSAASFWASRPRRKHEGPTGVIGRICPTCQERYDLSSSFCGHDGAELLVIN